MQERDLSWALMESSSEALMSFDKSAFDQLRSNRMAYVDGLRRIFHYEGLEYFSKNNVDVHGATTNLSHETFVVVVPPVGYIFRAEHDKQKEQVSHAILQCIDKYLYTN